MTGYRDIPASDPVEQNLRDRWKQVRQRWEDEGCPSAGPARWKLMEADKRLADYLWKRAEADIEKDRVKHPKAKRNQPFTGNQGEGRTLP